MSETTWRQILKLGCSQATSLSMFGEPRAPQSWAHVGLGYVRLTLGHLDLSWAHVGPQTGYIRLILGHLLGHLFGTNVCHMLRWA